MKTGSEAIHRVIGKSDCLVLRAELAHDEDRAENLFIMDKRKVHGQSVIQAKDS